MGTRTEFKQKSDRLWRSVVPFIVGYAFIIQGLLAGFAGLPAYAVSDGGLPVFELCLNGAHETPDSPAGAPGDACSHCILCFAGSQDSLGAPPPCPMQPVDIEIGSVSPPADNRGPWSIDNYSAAQPRAPPPSV
jgi:hypothetical protein